MMNYGMPASPGSYPQQGAWYMNPYGQAPSPSVGSAPPPVDAQQGIGNHYGHGNDEFNPDSGAASMYSGAAQRIGQGLYNRGAPVINTAPGNAYGQNFSALQQGAQTDALGLAGQTARGQGAAIQASDQATQQQFQANLGQQINAGQAMANSARGGGPGLAAAQGGAMQGMAQQSSASAQQAGQAASQARAGLISGAQQQYGAMGLGMGAQTLQAQQQQYQLAGAQAQLGLGQEGLNQQGLLAEQGMGQTQEQMQAAALGQAYATAAGLQSTGMQVGAQQQGQAIGGALAAAGTLAAVAA